MKTPHQFYSETNGKYIGNGQCWGLWDKFTMEYVNAHFLCLWVGGAKDMWYHFKELHLDRYFEQITDRHKLQDGDWLVWDTDTNPLCWISKARNEKGIAYGHIAMFRQYNPSNPEQNVILTQNPGGNPNYTHQMVCDFLGFVGALRPKCYIKGDTTPLKITKCDIIPNAKDKSVLVDWEATNGTPNYAKYILNGVEYGLNIDNIIPNLELDKEYKFQLELRKSENNIWTTSDEQTFIIESPKEPPHEENCGDSPIIPKEPKTPEIVPNKEKKDNIFIFILKLIVSIIKKLDRR